MVPYIFWSTLDVFDLLFFSNLKVPLSLIMMKPDFD